MFSHRFASTLLMFVLCCLAVVNGYALIQQSTHPCRDEIRAWASKEMIPVMRQWKSEFDAHLSAEERRTLDNLRAQARVLVEKRRTALREFEQSVRAYDENSRESMRSRMRELRGGMEDDWENVVRELAPIAKAHKDDLINIGTKAAPVVFEWKKTITTKLDDCRASIGVRDPKVQGRFAKLFEDWLMMDPASASQAQKRRSAIRFMLWDGADLPIEDAPSIPSMRAGSTNMTGVFTLSQCSPNPVSGERTNIQFSLTKTDHVKISVLDIQGSEVLVVSDKQFAAGSNVCEAQVGSLPNGQYSVRLICSEGMLYTALIIAR